MPRNLRIDTPGAWYLITNRGARRRDVFLNDTDRRCFIAELVDATDRFGVQVVAFVLMGNHWHLILHCPVGNLSATIQRFASRYVRGFNARHGFDGPQYKARFHSLPIVDDAHLATATRYVHRNALELGRDIANDPWSSYGAYIGRRPTPAWLHPELPLEFSGGQDNYRQFVESNRTSDDILFPDPTSFSTPWISEEVQEQLQGLDRAIAREANVSVASLYRPTHGRPNIPRDVAALLATEMTPLSSDQVAARYGFERRNSLNLALRRARSLYVNGQEYRPPELRTVDLSGDAIQKRAS